MARVRDLWRDSAGGKTKRDGRGKRWLAVWNTPAGEHTRAFHRKEDAKFHASTQETDAARGLYVSPRQQKITVGDWCDTWLAGYGSVRQSTRTKARTDVTKIKAEFGALPLAAVRPSHVKQWLSRLAREDVSASYRYALHARLSQVLGDAVHDGLLTVSPCSRKTSPGQAEQRPYVATTAQVWALAGAVPERLRIAILLGAFAGLRTGEACGLRPGDVDFMRGVIHPRVQFPALDLKTAASRTPVPVPPAFSLQLSAHVQRWPGAWILTTEDGTQAGPWSVTRAVRAHREAAGLDPAFRFHDLRHYFASLLIAGKADVKTVQARLRHASAKTTLDTYGHLWPDRDESTRALIEAVFQDQTEQSRNSSEII